eukprot:jgi/Picre1/31445/NNA_006797.t1
MAHLRGSLRCGRTVGLLVEYGKLPTQVSGVDGILSSLYTINPSREYVSKDFGKRAWSSASWDPSVSGEGRYERMSDVPPEGIVTVRDPITFKDNWHAGMSLKEAVDSRNKEDTFGLYVDLPKRAGNVVAEATASFYHHPELTRANVRQFDYGCKGAMQEFNATGQHMCMYRPCLDELYSAALDEGNKGSRVDIVLDGWKGSGKTVALYSLAALAREKGWVVMFVPSASLLVQGGMFKRKDEDEAVWYTPQAAHHILRAVFEPHAESLEKLSSLDGRRSLGDVCRHGLETKDDFERVDAAIEVMRGLLRADGEHGIRTLVIVDEYNYLYHRTEYHETMHQFHRRRIEPRELKLASAFMLSEQDREAGIVATACTHGGPISPRVHVPIHSESRIIRVPRFSLEEVSNMCSMMVSKKLVPELPPDDSLRRALALTNGNGKEIREGRTTLFQKDCGMALSFGRKNTSKSNF